MTERAHHEWRIVAEQNAKSPSSAAPLSGTIRPEDNLAAMARGGGVAGGSVLE
jgi:hypothetical protein